ncbi:MAG: hypothetical protein ABSA49_12310 [Rhizomicrobium sp.]|jgi:hypothetical protein
MKAYRSLRGLAARVLGSMVVASLPLGLSVGNAAEPAAVSKPASQSAAQLSEIRKAWNAQMLRLPLPKSGCFNVTYPQTEWREVPCGRPSPARNVVGDGTDYVAQSSGNLIASSTGTFVSSPSIAGSETGIVYGTSTSLPNVFTLQMNSQSPVNSSDGSPFNTPACGGVAGCSGWEQFVFSQTQGPPPTGSQQSASPGTTPGLFIEYWIYNFGSHCPALPSWAVSPSQPGPLWNASGSGCWFNSPMTYVTPLTSADLPGAVMKGEAAGANDTVKLTTTSGASAYSAPASELGLSNAWTETEFNVVGDGGGSRATFTGPTNLVVSIGIADGVLAAPTCVANDGTTGETNSLTLSGTPMVIPVLSEPRIEFTETNSSPTTASCSHSIGDTHLLTFDGLFYDFQAAGDFVLAQADPDFVVQTRQVSGAPSWPLADLNHAVATQMGKSRVAICVLPTRLFVDGKPRDLGDGKSLSLPGGVRVYRGGNSYAVMRDGGDIVNAQIDSNSANTWIDVTVGVGRSSTRNARGLLANPNGNVGKLAARGGTEFAAPVSFADLYHPYADSWRVQSKETLLSPCGDRNIETSVAAKPFYAKDLDPKLADRSREICTAHGVKEGPQLEACMLDTTVLGGEEAAKVFVRTLPIRAELRPDLPLKRIEIKPIIRRP